jgi:sulfur carrier protein ThiS
MSKRQDDHILVKDDSGLFQLARQLTEEQRPEGSVEITPVGLLQKYIGDRETPIVTRGGQTVAEVIETLAIPAALVAVVLINGRQELKNYVLQDGDVVKLVPLVGGG